MRALNIAATGMAAQQTRVEVISNNIANMSTTAYSGRRAEFADLVYQQVQRAGAISSSSGTELPAGIQIGLGVRTAAISTDVLQGSLKETGGDLDLAIEGQGYFEVELPSGESAYTRDGSFKLTGEGLIVTSDGYPLVPEITIPEDASDVDINASGEVYVYFDDQTAPQLLGQITIATFINDKGLESIGSNLLRGTVASGSPEVGDANVDGRGAIRQSYLEQSSIDVVAEITELIEAQRGYELNSKVITAADQMLSATSQIR
jgi:flagellar basal-body rod protein FlgG